MAGLVALLAVIVAVDAQADRRRRSTTFFQSSETSWPEWDGLTVNPELTDDHPTTGWPTESGRICVTFTSGDSGEHRAIIDGRTGPDDPRPYLSVVDNGRIRFGIQTVGSIDGGEIIPFHTHTACIDRTLGTTTLILDGQIVGISKTLPPWNWHPTARLGSRYGGTDPLGGTMALIQWRGLRLVCDMSSSTCSDGRPINTTRSTPVPCETSPGVWTMVPENTGCYSVRGLESWGANTNYLSWGGELNKDPWVVDGHSSLRALEGGGYRLCHIVNTASNQGIRQTLPNDPSGTYSIAAIARANTGNAAELGAWGTSMTLPLDGEWSQITVTGTSTGTWRAFMWPRPTLSSACIDIRAIWMTMSDTPGRPCWGGERPVHCAADRHTISTEGWPTEEGEICLKATVSRGDENTAVILDGRTDLVGQGPYLAVTSSGRIYWQSDGVRLNGPTFPKGTSLHICAGRLDGKLTLSVNGVSVPSIDGPALAWDSIAVLGDSVGDISQYIDGPISDLRIRGIR